MMNVHEIEAFEILQGDAGVGVRVNQKIEKNLAVN
jgi:hypothetical protein